ncbi:hypothetical protein ACTQ5F_07995 [Jeotgalibaca porci]|uniref:hypothetical protein n=1 Tax=Jeotgalibaca porci TaxID=1868793 RepID=UPI003F92F46A
MLDEVKDMVEVLQEEELFQDLPKEKLIDYAMQLVIARNIKSGLHGIESSVDYS